MFDIRKETIVYIVAPTTYFNGGGELLHQLCDQLNSNGKKATMCYWDKDKQSLVDIQLPEHIKKYNIQKSFNIEDEEKNIVITPEQYTEVFRGLNNVQKCIWWLGMNQYFWYSELWKHSAIGVIKHWVEYIIGKNTPLPPFRIKGKDYIHLAQCWYGVSYLNKRGFHNVGYLSDYINVVHENAKKVNNKENIIIYNPKRNLKYLKKIMKYDENVKYIPIEGMTETEVTKYMDRAKIYVDFGSHPGKDRMPREAVLHGCCVLTSTAGSADFWNDVPIDTEFKFDRTNNNIPNVCKKIHDIFDNFERFYHKFDFYREYVLEEKNVFKNDVKRIFR